MRRWLGRVMATPRTGALFNRLSGYPLTWRLWGAGQWHLYRAPLYEAVVPGRLRSTGTCRGRQGLVLDDGCGTGHLLHNIGRLVDPGRSYFLKPVRRSLAECAINPQVADVY